MKTPTISSKNLPTHLPVCWTATTWLILDRLNVSGWVWGVAGTVFFFLWLACTISIWNQDNVDIFDMLRKGGGR